MLINLDDEKLEEQIASPEMNGKVTLRGYKSSVILEVSEKRRCPCSGCQERVCVWLRGQEIDDLIASLRRARQAYRRAATRAGRDPKTGKPK